MIAPPSWRGRQAWKSVGAFSATDLTSTRGVGFTDISPSQALSRSGDLTLQWSDADPAMQNGQVTIGGYSFDNGNYDHYAMFQCSAPAAAKSFTVPGWILSTLPASGTGQNGTLSYPLGWIWIGQYNNPVTFQAPRSRPWNPHGRVLQRHGRLF